jgi:hypothetical protein
MIKMTAERLKYGDPKKAVKAGVTASNLSIGVAIASQAKLLVPVDLGQLRNSLSASNLKETKLLNNRKGKKAEPLETTGLKDDEVYVGSNCDHNIYQEYGTVLQPAQPYLRPSAELVIEKKEPAEIISKYCREKMEEELENRKKLKAEGKNPWT